MKRVQPPLQNYWTGKKDSFQQLVSRANTSGFLMRGEEPKLSKKRKTALERRIDKLDPAQVKLLAALLAGEKALISVGGGTYALRNTPDGWTVQSIEADAIERVVKDGKCTCPRFTKGGKRCKHIQAVELLCQG